MVIWYIVKLSKKIGICNETFDKDARVTKPDDMLSIHPWWTWSINRAALITYWEGFPLWSVPCWCHVNLLIHLVMIMKWRCIAMRSQSSSPQSKKVVNITGRHLVLAIEKVSHFKFDSVRIGMPSETGFFTNWLFYRDGIWVKGIAKFITNHTWKL